MSFQDRAYYRDEPGTSRIGGGLTSHSMVTWLLVINSAMFILDAVLTNSMRANWASPFYWLSFDVERGLFGGQAWRWLTYQFLHAGFFHILFNMIGLYFFGRMMESWWGSKRFLAFYLACGTLGAVLYTIIALLAPGLIFPPGASGINRIPLVGASGSVFGILAGCAVVFPHQRVMLLIPPIPMSMRTLALVFLGISALSLLAGSQSAPGEAVHLGGALLGFLLVKKSGWLNWADRVGFSRTRDDNSGRWAKRLQREEEARQRLQNEVDRILAKVKDKGLQSLTRGEKKTLQEATDRQRRVG